MDNNRTMELLRRAVNHIESFEEDQSAEVLDSLGFTQRDLAEIEAFAVREDSERKGSQYYPLQKFNSNEECAYALHRYLIKHEKESASHDVYVDILHDINNLRGHEWLEGIKRNRNTERFFNHIPLPEYHHDGFLSEAALPANLFLKIATNIGIDAELTYDEVRDLMDQNGLDHLWDYPVSDLEEAVSNNDMVLAVSFYEDDTYSPRIFECDDEIADRYFAIEHALSDGMSPETVLSHDFSSASISTEYGNRKAVDIEWDVDSQEDREDLPTEIDIPDGMEDVDDISDYISDITGFCHKGFALVEDRKKSLDSQIQSAFIRASESTSSPKGISKEPEPEI